MGKMPVNRVFLRPWRPPSVKQQRLPVLQCTVRQTILLARKCKNRIVIGAWATTQRFPIAAIQITFGGLF